MTNRHILFLLLIFFLLSSFVHGTGKEKFTISFEPFVMNGMDDNYLHLANSIPGMISYGIKDTSSHLLSREEMASLNEKYFDDIRKDHFLKLSDFIEKYNTYIFSRDFKKSEYLSLGKQIENQYEVLNNLEDIDIPDQEPSIPIEFIIDKTVINSGGSEKPKISDLVIKGSVEKLDKWTYLQVSIENNILGTEELFYESISSPDTITELIPEIISKLKTLVLGRVWSSVAFEIVPEDSNIIITRKNEKILHQSFNSLYPGVYEIEVSTKGYISKYFTIELEEYKSIVIPVKLEEEAHVNISVQSFPSGADLYSGATWIGKTPLLMKNPIIPALLTLKLEGFNNNKFVYKDKENRDIQIYMQLDIIDHDSIISRKRDKFYHSFGYFMLSIPVTMIGFGMSSDYGHAYYRELVKGVSSDSTEANRLRNISNAWHTVYYGGVFLNLTLFVNTIFDLVGYIKSNDRL